MNFSPFGGHFPATIPSIHQFAAKFTHDGTSSLMTQDGTNRYHTANMAHFNQHHTPLGVPVNMGKFRQTDAGTIVSSNNTNTSQHNMMNNVSTSKYHTSASNITHQYTPSANIAVPYSQPNNIQQNSQMHVQNRTEDKGRTQINNSNYHNQAGSGQNGNEIAQDLCAIMQASGQLPEANKDRRHDKSVKQEREQQDDRPASGENEYNNAMHQQSIHHHNQSTAMPATWQSLAAPGSTVADYLSHLPASTLPLSLHHFLKYSAESIKKESLNNQQADLVGVVSQSSNLNLVGNGTSNMNLVVNNTSTTTDNAPAKKKKKKKAPKEKKPRPKPGEIRLTTALDGSTLYCCPECQMAYPEKELLEQHLVGHTLERRFVCDICNAALKRKDHLTRHKQSHNPERPYVCTVCLKAFKRKEQLTLHFVIHSGEKRHICPECGKGFYRKDHLRKHTRSHIARRVKAELSQQSGPTSGNGSNPTPQSASNHQNNTTSVSNQTSMITAHVLQGAQVATPTPLPQPPGGGGGQSLLS